MTELQTIAITQLQESKTNPRQFFDRKSMAELAASIKESGIEYPLLVRVKNGHHEIVDGARRFRAAQEAKLTTVPVIIRELTDQEALEVQVIVNDQRSDVHPLEQCAGYQRLQKEGSFTLEQLAQRLGKSVNYVAKRLQYASLIEPIRKIFFENKITAAHATLCARLTPEQQKEIMKWKWLGRGETAESLRGDIARQFFLILKEAPFDTQDEKLVPKAGSCVNCPKRTGFNKALFEDVTNADTCTDPSCFENKLRAFIKIQVGTHKDAVLLTVADEHGSNRSQAKHLTAWAPAGNQNCPDTKEGIIVENVAYRTPYKMGQALKICVNLKCKTHHPAQPRSDYDFQTGKSRKAEKARKIELRRRGMVFKELASDPFTIDNKNDYRAILDWAVQQLSSDEARSICQAMQWEVAAAKYGGKDYAGTIQKKLAKLDTSSIHQWLYLVMLAGKDLWFYSGSQSKATLLEAKAKEASVPLAEIAKLAKETKADAKKRLKAESKKAASKSKK
jgi:ParB family chromosome partitioning protein